MEREHERDEFQQEIKNLEAQLKMPSKGHTGGDSKGQRVSNITPSNIFGCLAVGHCFHHVFKTCF